VQSKPSVLPRHSENNELRSSTVSAYNELMPIYVYETIRSDGKSGRQFELSHKASEGSLKKHPKTGKPIRRVFSMPSLPKNRFERTVKKTYGNDSIMTKSLLNK